MAIISDGTQSFAIESSPLSINGTVYVCESLSINQTGSRVDINDSSGEPLGSTVVPGRREISGTIQLAVNTTASNVRGQEFTLAATDSDINGTYLITECSNALSQGEYAKVTFSGYQKIN